MDGDHGTDGRERRMERMRVALQTAGSEGNPAHTGSDAGISGWEFHRSMDMD